MLYTKASIIIMLRYNKGKGESALLTPRFALPLLDLQLQYSMASKVQSPYRYLVQTIKRDSSTRFSTSSFFHESTPFSPRIHIQKYFWILFQIRENIRI